MMISFTSRCALFCNSFKMVAVSPRHTLKPELPTLRGLCTSRSLFIQQQQEETNAESAPPPPDEAAVQQLKEQCEKLQTELSEMTDKYKRSLAETENVRTRMRRQVEDAKQFAVQGFCKDLIVVADTLQLALDSLPKQLNDNNTENVKYLKSLQDGLQMTHGQLLKTFETHGLAQINPSLGEKFDPQFHEGVFQIPDLEKEPGTVGVVTKIGYHLHNRVIRAAAVGVVSKK